MKRMEKLPKMGGSTNSIREVGMCTVNVMCKRISVLAFACLAGLAGVQSAFGDANPAGCAPASDVGVDVLCVSQAGVTNRIVGQTVVVGETILYQGRVFQNRSEERRVGKECRSRW